MKSFLKTMKQIAQYPSAIVGLSVAFVLVAVSVYAVVTIPYKEAIRLWRGGEEVWYANPKNASPIWFNYFTEKKQPVTQILNSELGEAEKVVGPTSGETTDYVITYTFDYSYDDFPSELNFYFTTVYAAKQPFVAIRWITPDGRELRVADFGVSARQTYRAIQDEKLKRRLGGLSPEVGLFADPASDPENPTPLKGTYHKFESKVLLLSLNPILILSSCCRANWLAGLAPITCAAILQFRYYGEPL